MLPAIRPATGKHVGAGVTENDDDEEEVNDKEPHHRGRSFHTRASSRAGGHRGESDEDEDNEGVSHPNVASRPMTGVNFVNIDGSKQNDSDGESARDLEDEENDQSRFKHSHPQTAEPRVSGRMPLGWVQKSKRPYTQGGPNGDFPSSIPEHAKVTRAMMRGRAVLKTPGVKVFHMQDTTYELSVETGSSTLSLRRMSRTAHGNDMSMSYGRQKKLVSVPYIRKRPATTVIDSPIEKVIPEHLMQRWRYLLSKDERRDLEKNYSTRYKQKEVMAWKWDDVLSFVGDCFINATQVDIAGLPLPKRVVMEDGVRADACLDMLVMREVRRQMINGKTLIENVKRGILAKKLKLHAVDPSLADALSTAAQDYLRVNSHQKVENFEGITAKQTFEAAQAESTDEVLMQDLMVREIELRRERARLTELRERLVPLDAKFAQGVDECKSLKQHYDRLKTPNVREFVRPKSRRDVLSLKRIVDEDLAMHQDKWFALKKQEQELAKAVREEEMATLALRQQVESAQMLREERRREMWEDQMRRAKEIELERDQTMEKVDVLLTETHEMIKHSISTVQTQFDRSERNKLLRLSGDNLFAAKKMMTEACRYEYRRKRIELLEGALESAVEKLREGDMHLSKIQAKLVSAASVPDDEPHAVTALEVILTECQRHLREAKRDYKRTGALYIVAPNMKDFEVGLESLNIRISKIVEAGKIQTEAAETVESKTAADDDESQASADEEVESGPTLFEETLERLIVEKQRQTLVMVSDSLCSMQQWLFEVKAKSKSRKPPSSSGDSKQGDKKSESSTRPASPRAAWARPSNLPPVTGPASPARDPARGKTAATPLTGQSSLSSRRTRVSRSPLRSMGLE